jgi:hypothetical protein
MDMMDPCPTPEDMVIFSSGSASEQSWRLIVRHLSRCVVCRRGTLLLDPGNVHAYPEPRTAAPELPLALSPRSSVWGGALRGAAAAGLLFAMAWALILMNRPREELVAPPTLDGPNGAVTRPGPRPRLAVGEPLVPESKERASVEAPLERHPTLRKTTPYYPLPPSVRDGPEPAPAPMLRPGSDPPPTALLAERTSLGVAEAIEVAAGSGAVTIVSESKVEAVGPRTYLRPSETLVSEQGGCVVLPDGSRVHLSPKSEVKVVWSQTLVCYAVELRKDEALIDLGPAPRDLHVGNGRVGVRLRETSGRVLLSTQDNALWAIPLGPAVFRSPTGVNLSLRPREALVLRMDRDAIETSDVSPEGLGSVFPSLKETPRPVQPPLQPMVQVERPPDVTKLLHALATQGYGYRVSGRQVREGVWLSSGVLVSTIEDITVARQQENPKRSHFQKGKWVWDAPGAVKPGTREERLLETVRSAQPPHLILQHALELANSELQRRKVVAKSGTILWECTLDPQKVRPDLNLFLQQSVREGHLDRPDFIYWETVEGAMELTTLKEEPRLLRAVDRRRVAFSYNTVSGLDRRWYELETVYEFSDPGRPNPRVPQDVLKDLDPTRR